MEETRVWKAAAYCRISRDDGDKEESDSIANQRVLISAYIGDKADMEHTACYEDDGYTGVNYDRPAFKRMIEDIKGGKIDLVCVKDLSRLGRNYIETGKLTDRFFPFMGTRFIAITDGHDSLYADAASDSLIIPIKNLINDAYCADTSKKIRSQFEARRKKGEFVCAFAPYGYKRDSAAKSRLVPDEGTAHIVRDIFRRKIGGMSQQAIADRLNEMGVPSPLEQKKADGSGFTTAFDKYAKPQWTAVAVGRILRNDVYIGVLTQGKSTTPNYKVKQRIHKLEADWARVENAHEQIIAADDFSLVQRLLLKDMRVKPGGGDVYLFSGLVFCGDCGRTLVRKPAKNDNYTSFVCDGYKKKTGCNSHYIGEKLIYDVVLTVLRNHIRQCAEMERLMAYIDDMPMRRAEAVSLRKQIDAKRAVIDKVASRITRLYEDYGDGFLDRAEFTRIKASFDAQAAEAKKAIEALNAELERVSLANADDNSWARLFQKHRDLHSLTRAAVVELIDKIEVYEGKRLKITFRYQDDFETAAAYLAENGEIFENFKPYENDETGGGTDGADEQEGAQFCDSGARANSAITIGAAV